MKRFLRLGVMASEPVAAGVLVRCVRATRRVVSEGCTAVVAGAN